MFSRLMAVLALAAVCALSAGPAPAATAAAPAPTSTPLKTIVNLKVTRLCTGLRRSVGPAVRSVLQNDHAIAISRPLFKDYVKSTSTGSQAATDMDVMHLERLIQPLVQNTQMIEKLLNDPIYAHKPQSEQDRELLQIRAHLAAVLEEQKHALDLVSGFVDTQQLGELQAAGHEYDKAINSSDTTSQSRNGSSGSSQTPNLAPTTAPADILNAGVTNAQNDPGRKYDPRFQNTGSQLGYNPLNAFDQQMEVYQVNISHSEDLASQTILKAVPQCGGHVPAQTVPAPVPSSPVPAPAGVPAPLPTATPTPKP